MLAAISKVPKGIFAYLFFLKTKTTKKQELYTFKGKKLEMLKLAEKSCSLAMLIMIKMVSF